MSIAPRTPLARSAVHDSSPIAISFDVVQRAALSLFAERGYRATTMADIGAALGIRGPSVYRHIRSKQDVLAAIMIQTMNLLLAGQNTAIEAGGDAAQRVRRMVETHVRFHALHREQAFVGNREIGNLEPANRDKVLELRRQYENGLRDVIAEGAKAGLFSVTSARLASYAILDMGMGVAAWFREGGPSSSDEIALAHADFALGLLQGLRQ